MLVDVRLYSIFIATYCTVGTILDGRYQLTFVGTYFMFTYILQYIITLKPQPFLQQNSI